MKTEEKTSTPEKFGERFVKKLLSPVSGYKIYNVGRGFGVRVDADGRKSFCLCYYTNYGKKRRYKIGDWPGMLAEDALRRALELREEIRAGGDPVGERDQQRHSATVDDLARDYMTSYASKNKRPSSIRNDRQMLDGIILPKLGKMQVKAVTRRDVELLHGSLKSTPYRANRVRSLLSSLLTYAGMTSDANPVHGVKRYEEPKREMWLSLEQLQALEGALADYPDQVAADAIRLLIVTGSREGEVLSAEWSQFDLKRGVWTKPSHHTKQKKTEHVPLNRAAMMILARLRKHSTSQFLFPGVPLEGEKATHRVTIRKPWMQVLRAAGLAQGTVVPSKRKGMTKTIWKPLVRVHDLRHSFASHLVSSGASLYLVGKLLGHTQASTTQRYAHCSPEALREVANSFPMITSTLQ